MDINLHQTSKDDLVKKLTNLEDFMKNSNDGLAIEVPEGNNDMLTNSMGVIRDIRAEDKKTGPMLESGVL